MRVLELFRPTVGAATLGFARRAIAEALARSTGRVAFKKPIAEHQLSHAKLAGMAVKIDAAALLVYRAAWQADSGEGSIAREGAMAKLFASEGAFEVIDEALQIFRGLHEQASGQGPRQTAFASRGRGPEQFASHQVAGSQGDLGRARRVFPEPGHVSVARRYVRDRLGHPKCVSRCLGPRDGLGQGAVRTR